MSYPAEIAARAMYASVCAYQIHAKGTTTTPKVPVQRRAESTDGSFFYDVAPDYQNPVGFVQDAAEFTPAFFATGPDLIHAALIGLTGDGYVVVALRGTIAPNMTGNDFRGWVADWANDADAEPVKWTPYGGDWGQIATGFGKGAILLWSWIEETLAGLIGRAPKGIIICGHGKGAAMTFLIASLVATRWPKRADDIQVHAFAAPVIGDAGFVAGYEAVGLAPNTYRYQVENDLVPFLPIWNGADVWQAITFSKMSDEVAWLIFVESIRFGCLDGGYFSVGSFHYFTSAHRGVPGAKVGGSALPAVVAKIEAEDFETVVSAHSAVMSYLPCFAPTPAPSQTRVS
ncbi:MAG: lipase family protein [Rhodobacteraceae bacterium]|nr:lipase family protein [Paracoccaceae bacterium]